MRERKREALSKAPLCLVSHSEVGQALSKRIMIGPAGCLRGRKLSRWQDCN